MVWMIGLSALAALGNNIRTDNTHAVQTAVRAMRALLRPGNTNFMVTPMSLATWQSDGERLNGSCAGPSLVRRAGAGPDDHRGAVGGGVAVDVEAQSRLDSADGA